jgi:hypothetical protein
MTAQTMRDDEIRRLLAQTAQLHDGVLSGTLNLTVVRRALEYVLTGGDVAKMHPGRSSYFVSLAEQINNVERWNKLYEWGFTDAQIAHCTLEARTYDWPGDRLQALVLVPSFSSPIATLRALMMAADRLNVFPAGLFDSLGIDTNFALMRGVEFEPDTLEWRHVDLGSHLWELDGDHSPRVFDIATAKTAAHAAVIAAAAHFPRWVDAISSGEAPGVIIPGYRVIYGTGGLTRQTEYFSLRTTRSQHIAMLRLCEGIMWKNCAIPTESPMPLGSHI